MLNIGTRVKVITDPHDGMIRFVGRVGVITRIDGEWYEVGVVGKWSGWFRAQDLEVVG